MTSIRLIQLTISIDNLGIDLEYKYKHKYRPVYDIPNIHEVNIKWACVIITTHESDDAIRLCDRRRGDFDL